MITPGKKVNILYPVSIRVDNDYPNFFVQKEGMIKEKGRWVGKKSDNFQVNSIASPYSAAAVIVGGGDVLLLWP